jgi:hypothetical protein
MPTQLRLFSANGFENFSKLEKEVNDWLTAKGDSILPVNSQTATCAIANGGDHKEFQAVVVALWYLDPPDYPRKSSWTVSRAGVKRRTGAKTMRVFRVVSRVVTGLYILSFVCLVLIVGAWRKMAGIATYGFLVMLAVGDLMSVIEWRWSSSGGDQP